MYDADILSLPQCHVTYWEERIAWFRLQPSVFEIRVKIPRQVLTVQTTSICARPWWHLVGALTLLRGHGDKSFVCPGQGQRRGGSSDRTSAASSNALFSDRENLVLHMNLGTIKVTTADRSLLSYFHQVP